MTPYIVTMSLVEYKARGDIDRYYQGSRVISEESGSDIHEHVRHGGVPVAERKGDSIQLLATDNRRSVIAVTNGEGTVHIQYAPSGAGNAGTPGWGSTES